MLLVITVSVTIQMGKKGYYLVRVTGGRYLGKITVKEESQSFERSQRQ